jgi:putative chitinase
MLMRTTKAPPELIDQAVKNAYAELNHPKHSSMINRKTFYDAIRPMYGKTMRQSQVEGIEIILNKWEAENWKDLRWLAYILATVHHETAKTMQPVREYGRGKGREYGEPHIKTGHIYYGRGYVQITWDYNYLRLGKLIGVDLYNNPELACEKEIAVKILFVGMIQGMFTGKTLGQYFNDETDWVEARRIVNGTDKAKLIAGYAQGFYAALT